MTPHNIVLDRSSTNSRDFIGAAAFVPHPVGSDGKRVAADAMDRNRPAAAAAAAVSHDDRTLQRGSTSPETKRLTLQEVGRGRCLLISEQPKFQTDARLGIPLHQLDQHRVATTTAMRGTTTHADAD